MGEIIFWEGNGCSQNCLGSIEVGDCGKGGRLRKCKDDKDDKRSRKYCVSWGEKKSWNLKEEKDWILNDEARSCTLRDVPAGTVIKVYDSPDGNTKDDWAEITVHKTTTIEVCVWSFEVDFTDEWYTINYYPKNGLNGKISRIEVSVPSR